MDPQAIIAATSRTRSRLQNQALPVADEPFDLARFGPGLFGPHFFELGPVDRGPFELDAFDLGPFDQWMRLADSLLNRPRLNELNSKNALRSRTLIPRQ